MKEKLLILFIISTASLKLYAQVDTAEARLLNNDSIHYKIIFISPSVTTLKNDPVSKRYVQLEFSRDFERNLLTKDSLFWISHLCNEKTDWATNLVLYCIYKRDATMITYVFNTREKWLKTKKDEIEYWKHFLSSQNP